VMVWMYYSSQIFLLGAEFTWVYAHRFGSLQGGSDAQRTSARPGRSPAQTAALPTATRAGATGPVERRRGAQR